MKRIRLFIPITPIGQGRPRFTVIKAKGGGLPFVSTYDPPESANYKNLIRQLTKLQINANEKLRSALPLSQALFVGMCFYMPREEVRGRKIKRGKMISPGKTIFHTGAHHIIAPDFDNLEKATLDALKGILWTDDKIICASFTEKVFAQGGQVGVRVVVKPYRARAFAGKQLTL